MPTLAVKAARLACNAAYNLTIWATLWFLGADAILAVRYLVSAIFHFYGVSP